MRTVALVLTNCTGGGTFRHVSEMINAWINQKKIVILIAEWHDFIAVTVWKLSGEVKKYPLFSSIGQWDRLIDLLEKYDIEVIHIHHLLNARKEFFELANRLQVPYVVTLHDYYSVCPFINLIDENGIYCGEKGDVACDSCLKRRHWISNTTGTVVDDIHKWHKMWHDFLLNSSKVIVPSYDMFVRIQRYFQDINLCVFENPELVQVNDEEKNVGLIGEIDKKKGAGKIKEVLAYVSKNKLPLRFILFGQLKDVKLTHKEKKYIDITGAYSESDVYRKIRSKKLDFFWFPGVLPETYSYTLTIPIRLRIPCIASDIGAIAGRIKKNSWGDVYRIDSDAEKIVKKLLEFDFKRYSYMDFTIKNNSFGDISEFYKGIRKIKKMNIKSNSVPDASRIEYPKGMLYGMEFRWCWSQYNWYGKIKLLLHINIEAAFRSLSRRIIKRIMLG